MADLRERLVSVGLEAEAAVFGADGFDHAREARIGGLWDGAALSRSYARQHAELMAWLERSALLDDDVAARESYLLGEAIRQVVFHRSASPELVDTVARTQFVATVRRFDAAGKAIWRGVSGGRAFMPLADPG